MVWKNEIGVWIPKQKKEELSRKNKEYKEEVQNFCSIR